MLMSTTKPAPKSKLLTAELLWQLSRIGPPSLSPDGAQAVAAVTSYDTAANKGSASLWLFSTLGGAPRRLTSCGEKDGAPRWSPSGDCIAFTAKRDQEGSKDSDAQLYAIAPDGGEARRLTSVAGGVQAFKWFPDGKRIAFTAWVYPKLKGAAAQLAALKAHTDRKDSAYVTEEAQYRYWDHNIAQDRVVHLHVLHVESGEVFDLFEGGDFELARTEHDATHFDVSPDNSRVAFSFDPALQKRGDNCWSIIEMVIAKSPAKRLTKILAQSPGWDHAAPSYGPNGKRIACLSANIGKRHTLQGQLTLIDLVTNKSTVVSDKWDRVPTAPLHWLDDETLAFKAEDFAQNHLWQFDLNTQTPTILARGGTVQGFDVANGVASWIADSMNHPVRLSCASLSSVAAITRLDGFNDALLADVALGAVESVTYKGANSDAPALNAKGHTAHMWVIYPPGFDATQTYPLMHAIHGGPHAASLDAFHYRWNNQVFAAQGYVVACVNYHGSSSFGYAFLDSITHRWGELELLDIEAATDLMVKKPFIDKKRLFATGGSYGGYMVAWMNGHLKRGRYAAYVCHAGCFDWVGMFSDDAWHWHAKELGAWYWDDMAKIHSQSPHAHAANLTTPTLVIHGQLDYRVPDAQGLAYYNTLKAQNVPARLVWFPDENHWILKPANAVLWYREFFNWLSRFDATPAQSIAPKKIAGKSKPT